MSVVATSSDAAAAYLRTGMSNIRIGLFLVVATVSGALAGAVLAGAVPPRILELLLGAALAYSAFTTVRHMHVEVPSQLAADPLAVRFGLEGRYYDRVLEREVAYRAVRVRAGLGAMFGADCCRACSASAAGRSRCSPWTTSCGDR